MLKIVADDKIPFLAGALEPFAHIDYLPGAGIQPTHIKYADALIIRTRTICNAKLLEGSQVKFIASATIGHDHIDQNYCRLKKIAWTNAPGCNADSVVQYVSSALAHILKLNNRPCEDITLGIIGAGNVGSRLLKVAHTLGLKTIINDPPRERSEGPEAFSSLDELLQKADIISLHVPLNLRGPDKTFYLANNSFFEKIKPGAWFINTARGEVVNTLALTNALKSGILAGAIIDVWENEPEIDKSLLELATIGTPHIAGYSADGKANGTAMTVQALSRFFNLGLNHWKPPFIPMPQKPQLCLSAEAKSKKEIFCELSLQAYHIYADHHALLTSPGKFEKLRGDYPIRREPPALKVVANHINNELKCFIRDLGYLV